MWKLISPFVAAIAALFVLACVVHHDDIAAQGDEILYYVFESSGQCWQFMNGSAPNDPNDVYAILHEFEWFDRSYSDENDGTASISVDQSFLICPSAGISHTVEYSITSYGEGGYRVDNTASIRVDTGYMIDTDSSVVGGSAAACLSNDAGVGNIGYGWTGDILSGQTGGLVARSRVVVDHRFCSAPVKVNGRFIFRLWEIGSTPPVIESYCDDGGIELITQSVTLQSSDKWVGNVNTGWERFYVQYTFKDTHDDGSLLGMGMWANDKLVSRRFYSDPSDSTDVYSFTVPNRTDPNGRNPSGVKDYDKYGFATGPQADLLFDNYYNTVDLISACVYEAPRPLSPSEWCPDGLEALEEPVPISAYGGRWSDTVYGIEYQHITVKYVVENPVYPFPGVTNYMKAVPALEYNLYWVEANLTGQHYITFTLPTTGVVKMYDDQLLLEWWNYGVSVNIASICVMDATDSMPQLTEEACNLTNPDFVYGLTGWSVHDDVSWTYWEENGAIEAYDNGLVAQTAKQEHGTVWNMEVRAKAINGPGDDLIFGTETTSIVSGGEQVYECELQEHYQICERDIFVKNGGTIHAEGDDAMIDYVCLTKPDGMLVPDCDAPPWDPPTLLYFEDIGNWLLYLLKWLGDIIMYGVCLLLQGLAVAANAVLDVLRNIILRIPALPNAGDGMYSWIEWLVNCIGRYVDWIGINLNNLLGWIPLNMNELARFLHSLYMEFILWLAEQLNVDPFWLLETLNAIWNEALLFWDEMQIEAKLEFQNLLLLLQNMANVMIVLVNGVREGVSGETVAYIGDDFEGIGAFIWEGVNFLNTAIQDTPLVGLNIVALAAIAIGLSQWTVKKFVETLEAVG